jgi:VWFA-related protein
VPQSILFFSNERVPVSLGLALDTSGSMAGEKIRAAQGALSRFLVELLGPEDEVFVYRFSDEAVLVQGWTSDRRQLPRLLGDIHPSGETVLYDTVSESIPLAKGGHHRKKALVVISDGNDPGSTTSVTEVQRQIRESEILVYAVGIDAHAETGRAAPSPVRPRFPPIQLGFPFPGGRRPPGGRVPRQPLPPAPPGPGLPPIGGGGGGNPGGPWNIEEPVNEAALRAMTDDSGGRTEIIRSARDLAQHGEIVLHRLGQCGDVQIKQGGEYVDVLLMDDREILGIVYQPLNTTRPVTVQVHLYIAHDHGNGTHELAMSLDASGQQRAQQVRLTIGRSSAFSLVSIFVLAQVDAMVRVPSDTPCDQA